MPDYETIVLEIDGGLATLTLNRPDRLNGMTNRMVRETHAALMDVSRAPDVRVLVLTGAGRGFCPGADLRHFSEGGGRDADEHLSVEHFQAAALFHEMPQVTIAAVNGACAGAGLGWALACDLRFAAASAVFNTAFLSVAVAGDMGGPWTLQRIVGAARARDLYFLPEKFSATDALEIGLVSRAFPDESFRAEIDTIARRLAAAAPLALRTMKQNFLDAERMDLGAYVALEAERHLRVAASQDTREAFAAFIEKRTPRFEGR